MYFAHLQSFFDPTLLQRTKKFLRMISTFMTIVTGFICSFIDIYSDIKLAISYYKEKSFAKFLSTLGFVFLPVPFCILWTCSIYRDFKIPVSEKYFPRKRKIPRSIVKSCLIFISATPFRCVLVFWENKTLHYRLHRGNIRAHCRAGNHYQPLDISHLLSLNTLIETALESSPQLLLQTYLLTVAFLTQNQVSQLDSRLLSICTSVFSIAWALRSQHCMAKRGKLNFSSSMVLFASIFFQVISRVIVFTLFSVTHTWFGFIVLFVHFICVFCFKYIFEKTGHNEKTKRFIYAVFGTFVSLLVYCRPFIFASSLISERTFITQTIYLILAAIENSLLLTLGLAGLNYDTFDVQDDTLKSIKVVCAASSVISFIVGVLFLILYYTHFHHDRALQYEAWRENKESHFSVDRKFAVTAVRETYCELKIRINGPKSDVSV